MLLVYRSEAAACIEARIEVKGCCLSRGQRLLLVPAFRPLEIQTSLTKTNCPTKLSYLETFLKFINVSHDCSTCYASPF